MPAWFRYALTLGLVTACGGSEQVFQQLEPAIAVNPSELAFGDSGVPLEFTQTLYVANAGKADLDVHLSFDPDLPQFDFIGPKDLLVSPDESLEVPVTFKLGLGDYFPFATELIVTSNDLENPEIRIPVSGTGVYQPLPDIDLSTQVLDCGIVTTGSSASCYFEVANLGDAALNLDTARFDGSGAFTFLPVYGEPSQATVAAGASLPVVVFYTPLDEEGDQATLTLPSNDPDEPEVEVILLGNGGEGFQLPVAVIDCPADAAPPEYVTMDGSASYDPNKTGISTYLWTLLAKPDGSQATFTAADGPIVQLFADSAGAYTVSLVVMNGMNIFSAPASCTFEAVPADALHIELTWDGPSSDLDLHLRHDTFELFDTPDDACWCNDQPAWGVAGSDDDPRLDLDDLSGLGPENINVLLPEDGRTLVSVHYFGDDYDGTLTATVRVYVYGVLISEVQHLMDEFDVWEVGAVDWPAGTLTLDGTMDTSMRKDCF